MGQSGESLTIVIAVDHASITGGQAKVALDSAVGLKRAGHRPILFAAALPIDPRMAEEGIEVVCLDQKDLLGNPSKIAAAVQGIWNSTAADAMTSLLARLPPKSTIVHVHGWAKALSPAIAGPIRRSGLPAVYTMHEYFMFCPNGGFYNYPKNHVCKLEPMSAACWMSNCDSINYPRKIWRAARLVITEHIAKLADTFSDYIIISKFQDGIVRHRLPKGVRIHNVSNPIAAEDMGRKANPASGDVIFVGRLSPEKGMFVFAEAARKAGITPVFVGDGPRAEELAQKYPEARMLGWKGPAEVRDLMRNAKALVFPSLWFEGQPLTVLEAKALGTPVVVSDGCAGREEITDGRSGLWFESANVDALAAQLEKLKDDAFVTQMSNAAYDDFWADPLTLQRHVGRIVAIYQDMIARQASGKAAA